MLGTAMPSLLFMTSETTCRFILFNKGALNIIAISSQLICSKGKRKREDVHENVIILSKRV